MDVISVIGGFIAGIVATVFSDAIAAWLARAVPMRFTRWLDTVAANPRLYFQTKLDTPERRIKELVEDLFDAWSSKDLEKYLACWADDAVRVVGPQATVEESKEQIREKFFASCERYAVIRVEYVAFESILMSPQANTAVAQVRYRFVLTRRKDGLPIVEDARELYSLRLQNGTWQIASNIDHFFVVGEHVAS